MRYLSISMPTMSRQRYHKGDDISSERIGAGSDHTQLNKPTDAGSDDDIMKSQDSQRETPVTKVTQSRRLGAGLTSLLVFLVWGLAAVGVYLARQQSSVSPLKADKIHPPNIVFILADDVGYNDIGYNNPEVITPNLDRLAKTGRIFTQTYFQVSCSPSRAALLTGKYPYKISMDNMGRKGWMHQLDVHCLPTNLKLLPEYLKEVGYKTHILGKWHLGFCRKECTPTYRGFDTFYGIYGGMGHFFNHTDMEAFPGKYYYDWHDGEKADKTVIGEYATEIITDRAIELLKSHDSSRGPIFLYVAHMAAHVPLHVPRKYEEMYSHIADPRRRKYLGMITSMDHEVQRIVETLKSTGLYDNTLIIFNSDNGGEVILGPSDNTPFRGTKGTLWEGGTRVPSFIHGTMIQKAGCQHDGMMHVADWFPTLLGIANVSRDGLKLDGIDQSRMVLEGAESERNEVVIGLNLESFPLTGQCAIRMGDYKLIWGHEGLSDGWGKDTHFSFDPDWTVMQRETDLELEQIRPYYKWQNPEFFKQYSQSVAARKMDPDDINSGVVHLFNLKDDPVERNDLAKLPEYQETLLQMKLRTLHLAREYNTLEHHARRPEQTLDAMVDGAWSPGWCDDVNMDLADLDRSDD